jgi:lipopolysaccharide/colanic/teichoic acid biosynthesis glycosyltransferase
MAQAEETHVRTRTHDLTRPARRRARVRDDGAIRALNVLVAAVALIVTLPIRGLVAIAIKLTSRGPVFYTQQRVGIDARRRTDPRRAPRQAGTPHAERRASRQRDDRRQGEDIGGRPFTIVKFRTMRVDAERSGTAVWASANDDRLTPIGGFLRSCRVDELPQLLNVIRGEMNLVGPRPERPQLFQQLRAQVPDYQKRQRVPPGITGHAQVHLKYDTSVEDVKLKVQHDLEYISRRTVWEDLRIMLKTIPVMLFRKGGW